MDYKFVGTFKASRPRNYGGKLEYVYLCDEQITNAD